MKALVTGSNGFIGSHLAEELIRRDYSVTCLVRETSHLRWIKHLDVELIVGDCRNTHCLERAVEGKDYVFHLGAVINASSWKSYYETNVRGTRNLLEACSARNRALKKFVFVSSISAAGPTQKGRAATESDPCRPISHYGRSKLLAEHMVLTYGSRFPVVIIRPPNVIGPRQKELFEAIQLIKKRIKPIVGNGEPQTSLCYVEDVARALILAAESELAGDKTYFLADPRPYAWEEITAAIAETLDIQFFLLRIPYFLQFLIACFSEAVAKMAGRRASLTRESVVATKRYYWIYDGSKIKKELGFVPRTGLKEAIDKTIIWYMERGLL